MERIPFVDMHARIAPLRDEMLAAMARVLDSGVFVMGPECAALEEEFARFCGVEHAVAVSTGTAALQLSLLAAGVGRGDEVITTAHTFIATAEAISAVGATPVFVDIDSETLLIDPARIEAAITPRTRAIIPVHLYGLMADMTAIMAIARRHRLVVVEDACQAIGARQSGKTAGSIGSAGCFSLYPAKNVGAVGEGGMITTNDAELAKRMRTLRSHGESQRYYHEVVGWNHRLSELHAATARIELRHADAWNNARAAAAAKYRILIGRDEALALQDIPDGNNSVYHLFTVQVNDRDAVRKALDAAGVSTGIHYPLPVHLQQAYADLAYREGSLPHTESAASRLLSLPMFPEITDPQIERVVSALTAALGSIDKRREAIAERSA